jgi:hypothetical protein
MASKTLSVDTIEPEVQRLARALYQKAAEHKPSLFEAKDLLGRMIDWSLEDESLRVALFRFVDVLPSLESRRKSAAIWKNTSHASITPLAVWLFSPRRSMPERWWRRSCGATSSCWRAASSPRKAVTI